MNTELEDRLVRALQAEAARLVPDQEPPPQATSSARASSPSASALRWRRPVLIAAAVAVLVAGVVGLVQVDRGGAPAVAPPPSATSTATTPATATMLTAPSTLEGSTAFSPDRDRTAELADRLREIGVANVVSDHDIIGAALWADWKGRYIYAWQGPSTDPGLSGEPITEVRGRIPVTVLDVSGYGAVARFTCGTERFEVASLEPNRAGVMGEPDSSTPEAAMELVDALIATTACHVAPADTDTTTSAGNGASEPTTWPVVVDDTQLATFDPIPGEPMPGALFYARFELVDGCVYGRLVRDDRRFIPVLPKPEVEQTSTGLIIGGTEYRFGTLLAMGGADPSGREILANPRTWLPAACDATTWAGRMYDVRPLTELERDQIAAQSSLRSASTTG